MGDISQGSEVARLLRQIHEEYESSQQGLTGLASGTSRHQIMTKKMENISKWHDELRGLVGDSAMELVVQQLSDLPDTRRPLVQ